MPVGRVALRLFIYFNLIIFISLILKTAKEENKKSKSDQLFSIEETMNEQQNFVPKTNSKIDYKPEFLGEKGYFIMALVKSLTKEPKDKGVKGPTRYKLTIIYNYENQPKSFILFFI